MSTLGRRGVHYLKKLNAPNVPADTHSFTEMSILGRRGIHSLQKLNAPNVPADLIQKGQERVIDASLTLIRERAKLKGELVRACGGAVATSSLLGIPLGHNSSFLQGPAFAPPMIREAIWCGSTNSTTEEGKELRDPRVLTDVGDLPVQEIRDCGVDDSRLMNIVSESVKLVMEQAPLRPVVLGGDHSISYPVVRAVSEKLGGPVDILHLDAHPDIYDAFEGNKYSHASSFARIMEGGYARRLLQVGIRSINWEGREQGKKFGVEQYEMRNFSKDRHFLENLVHAEGMELEENDTLWKLLKAFSWSNQKVNRDFGAQDSKIEALEVKGNDIPGLRPRNRKVNFRPGKSTEVNWVHMVNPEVKPEGITQRLMQDFPTSTRSAHLIG